MNTLLHILPQVLLRAHCVLSLFLCTTLWGFNATNINLQATATPTSLQLGETLQLKLTLIAQEEIGSPSWDYQAPDFEVISTSSSSSMSFAFGTISQRNSTLTTTIRLAPQRTGNLTITGIQANVKGHRLTAEPITITVTANSAPSSPNTPVQNANIAQKKPFLQVELGKKKYYKGEQLLASFVLYTPTKPLSEQLFKIPVCKGFVSETLDLRTQNDLIDQVFIQNSAYLKKHILRMALYPIQVGVLEIDPAGLQFQAPDPNTNAGDEDDVESIFFGLLRRSQPRNYQVQSSPKTIEIVPLPEEGKPSTFSGLVGSFEITAAADILEANVGQSITLKVQLQGQGSVVSYTLPSLRLPHVEEYISQPKLSSNAYGYQNKLWEIVLIPQHPGKITIPSIQVDYFNPDRNRYETARTEPITLSVEGTALKAQVTTPPSIQEKEAVSPNPPKKPQNLWKPLLLASKPSETSWILDSFIPYLKYTTIGLFILWCFLKIFCYLWYQIFAYPRVFLRALSRLKRNFDPKTNPEPSLDELYTILEKILYQETGQRLLSFTEESGLKSGISQEISKTILDYLAIRSHLKFSEQKTMDPSRLAQGFTHGWEAASMLITQGSHNKSSSSKKLFFTP